MKRRRETGCGMVWTRHDSAYAVENDEFERIKNAWMHGESFCTVRSYHGDYLTIKLATVEAMQFFTPEGIASSRAEDAADKAEDAIQGIE